MAAKYGPAIELEQENMGAGPKTRPMSLKPPEAGAGSLYPFVLRSSSPRMIASAISFFDLRRCRL